jgi:hypothetical protein
MWKNDMANVISINDALEQYRYMFNRDLSPEEVGDIIMGVDFGEKPLPTSERCITFDL